MIMNTETAKILRNKRKAVSILAGTVCFIVLSVFYIGLITRDLETEREKLHYIARNEAARIATTVDCVMARTNTLKALIQDHNGDTAFFDTIAGEVYDDVIRETGVVPRNIAIAPDGIVSDVYPLEGNESLIGFDFLDTTRPGNLEAIRAYELGSTVLTNPFELVQGGLGMGGRSPVIISDGEETRLWGLVTVTIDYNNLIEELRLDNLEGMGVDYTLSYIDEDGVGHIMEEKGEPDEYAVKTRFRVRNLTWEFEMSPNEGWISVRRIIFLAVIILIIAIFTGLFANNVLELRETNAILLGISNTDHLTGGPNRRAYAAAVSELTGNSIGEDFVYVSADLNGLKRTNDTLGHLAGDELIIGANECLCKAFGEFGNVYRIGGDEFAALIHADPQKVEELLEKLKTITKEWKGDSVTELSLSVGCVSHREFPDATMETLIRTADDRMYEAKRAYYQSKGIDRRNQWDEWEPERRA
ncbi:MAG: sensor domain-containing diguanylate cyclase [Lachnospiraceae bacterium]|nr:sensor domain-containing diguanylate cyclase [Lachnospiraceae bacterium]